MKSFKKHIHEKVIHFFDMDETLFSHGNRTKVHIKHSNGHISSLTNRQYNKYKKQHGDEVDYSEFESAKHFEKSAKPIHNVIKMLQRLSKKHKVEIMTARKDFDDKHHFGKVLGDHGIDFYKVHVRRAGNYDGIGAHDKKARHISDLINKHGYIHVHLYDDHLENLKSFLDLKKNHPNVTFHAHHVETKKGKTVVRKHAKF